MMILDASAALHLVLNTESGSAYRSLMLEGERTAAPRLLVSEVANALWKYVCAGEMSVQEATAKAQTAYKLIDEFVADEELMPEALHEAIACNHPAHDMLYLVLARRKNATLLTADCRLLALSEAAGIDCVKPVSIGD